MILKVIIFQKTSDTSYKERVENYNYVSAPNTKEVIVIPPSMDSNPKSDPTLLAPQLSTTDYNLVIYDWSLTLKNNDLATLISNTINLNTTPGNVFDVAYLGKWSDTCAKYTTLYTTNFEPFTIVGGTDPVGFNALLLSPSFSEKLNQKITAPGAKTYGSINYVIQEIAIDETVKYIAYSPNLFVYDPLYNAVDDNVTFYAKTQECVSFNSQVTPPNDNALTIFWILLIIVGVCIILWLMLSSRGFGLGKMDVARSGED
jgi:hypothetical protein